jgi:hypothetical protein
MAPVAPFRSWHRNVASIFYDVTGQRCQVTSRPSQARIEAFELSSGAPATVIDQIERDRGGRASVVPLLPLSRFDVPTVWVGWYEEWSDVGIGALELKTMSASFYWGIAGRRRIQLLRAEWVRFDLAPRTSAQPHWQVDTDFIGDATAVDRAMGDVTEDPLVDLVELTVDDTSQLSAAIVSISKLHLGMAGWRNGATYPAWWRVELGADQQLRQEWLRKTLQHAVDQFDLVTVA